MNVAAQNVDFLDSVGKGKPKPLLRSPEATDDLGYSRCGSRRFEIVSQLTD